MILADCLSPCAVSIWAQLDIIKNCLLYGSRTFPVFLQQVFTLQKDTFPVINAPLITCLPNEQ